MKSKHEVDKYFKKNKKKIESNAIENLLINDSCELVFGNYTVKDASQSLAYSGDKQFVVEHPYESIRGYNTISGALRYIQSNERNR